VLEEAQTDLYNLVHEVMSLMRVRAIEKRLNFTVEQSPDLPRFITVDAGKLRQVLINLMGNAIKYTAEGGVTLRVKGVKRGTSQRVRFEVEDTGPGLPHEDRDRVFQSFVQLGEQPHSEAGSGLGLAISKQNVEVMGGEIGVLGEPGKGSLFHFEIPVNILMAEAFPAEKELGRVIGLPVGQIRHRLLIAEDHPENRLLLHTLLGSLGYDVLEAENGEQAVALFEQWSPDLIWMDIRMPVMDGLEATRRIKATESGIRTKIVALTAHALEEERLEILAAGCDDLIRKPYRDEEIFSALEKHLGVRFLREDQQAIAEEKVRKLDASDLANVPMVLIRELAEAVELLEPHGCFGVIRRISDIHQELGERLHGMVVNVQYQELLAVLDAFTGENNL
jgi:CheY-like chemotaxis protein